MSFCAVVQPDKDAMPPYKIAPPDTRPPTILLSRCPVSKKSASNKISFEDGLKFQSGWAHVSALSTHKGIETERMS
jgi:hypothetical protein